MVEPLGERVRAVLDQGGEAVFRTETIRALVLVTLESGARYGIDGDARWIVIPGDGRAPEPCTPENAAVLHEALEWKRELFDETIEASARAHGLPADDVLFSFPVFDVVRAILAKRSNYLTRLALVFLRPTELRELRADIKAVLALPSIPASLRDLAERLVVPEQR